MPKESQEPQIINVRSERWDITGPLDIKKIIRNIINNFMPKHLRTYVKFFRTTNDQT